MDPSVPELKSYVDGIVGFHLWQADVGVGSCEGDCMMDRLLDIGLSKLSTHLDNNKPCFNWGC
jgi:hypothetical protein